MTEVISHAQRVRRVYKMCRWMVKENFRKHDIMPWQDRHLWLSRNLVRVRHEFEKNKNVDPVTAEKLLVAAEEKVKQLRHDVPYQFPHSPGGSAYDRIAYRPDSVLDFWHPLEKAQYPEYFARRDVRKREYLERWEKKYGKVDDLH